MKNISILILGLILSGNGIPMAQAEDLGPHGGMILSGGGQNVEVSVDSPKKRLRVHVLKRTKVFPGAIEISLVDKNGKSTQMMLKTIDANRDPLQYYTSTLGGSQSYVGFEIRIPLRKQPPLVLRSERGLEIK